MFKMAIKVVLLHSLFLIYGGVDCQLTVKPNLKEVCVGSDVAIDWTYGDANNFAVVTWTFIDSSSTETTIMQHANGVPANVIGGYNVQHDGNGAITLTNVALSNTGAYKIAVSYSSATPADEDTVSVTVNDPPAGLSASNTTSSAGITYTCIATSAGDPAANLYIQVNGADKTSTVSAVVQETDTVKCCVSGSSVECMSGVTSTVFCQSIQNGPTSTSSTTTTTTSSPTTFFSVTNAPSVNTTAISTATNPPTTTPKNPCDRTCIIIIIVLVIVVALALSVCAFVCVLLRRRRNIKKKKDRLKEINSNQLYDNDFVVTSDRRGYGENNRL